MATSIASELKVEPSTIADQRSPISLERTSGWVTFLWALAVLGIPSPELRAQAIIAPSGRTLFNRGTLVRSFVERQHLSLQTPDGRSLEITQYVTPLALVYGFHPQWTVILAQPYITADIRGRAGNATMRRDLNGLGDSQAIVQYDGLYQRNVPGGLTRLAGVFGVGLPTGARRFSTGALAYTGGLIFEKVARLRYAFTSDFEYTINTANDQGMDIGNLARFDAAPAYFLISRERPAPGASWLRKTFDRAFHNGAYVMLEFNGAWRAHAFDRGNRIPNTGGTTFSISPGIQYFLSPKLLVEFSAPIPAIKALNGIQPRPDSTFLVGFRFLL